MNSIYSITKMSNSQTQITSVENFNKDNLVFSKPSKNDALGTYRVNVGVRNPDKTVGDLVLPINWSAYSFGVAENRSKMGELQGYQISICMYDQNGPTQEQERWVQVYEEILDACRDNLVSEDVRKEIKKPKLTKMHLEDLCKAMYWKTDEDGNIIEGRGPTLYVKLMTKKNKDATDDSNLFDINTLFADEDGNELDPKELVGVRGRVRGAITFESIFIGGLIRLQVKAAEIEFQQPNRRAPRLFLREPPVVKAVEMEVQEDPQVSDADNEQEDSDKISDDEKPVQEPPVKAPLKKGRRLLRK